MAAFQTSNHAFQAAGAFCFQEIAGTATTPYPPPAGHGKGRGRPPKLRRWVLPNGMHMMGSAQQALDLAQQISPQPVVLRTERPKKPVIVKTDDGAYVEAQSVYPVERMALATAASPVVAQTQVSDAPLIQYEVIERLLKQDEQRRRRRRKAAFLLLMS